MKNKKVYIVCPDEKKPTGGIKQLYKLASILKKMDHDVYIIHNKKGFKINWFPNNVEIKYFPFLFHQIKKIHKKNKIKNVLKDFFKELFLNKDLPEKEAILIYPEIYGPKIYTLNNNKYIIFNQNCYYTFNNFPFLNPNIENTYNSKNILGSLTVSEDSKKYLDPIFPDLTIEKITLGIDPIFSLNKNKEKIITFMPRKLKEDFNQIFQILHNNPNFKDWKWLPIDNMSETEVAKAMQKSAIFLSFNYNEGFGLPPIEAMSCGCYVIGYAGNGGVEYFKDEFSSRIPDRNIIEFVNKIEEKVIEYNKNPLTLIEAGEKASQYIQKTYSLAEEEKTTIAAITKILYTE